jgi:hypothetical protein
MPMCEFSVSLLVDLPNVMMSAVSSLKKIQIASVNYEYSLTLL